MGPIRWIRRKLHEASVAREKRKQNPLIIKRVGGKPVFADIVYPSLEAANDVFGKKLKMGFNRVGKKEVFVSKELDGRVLVNPVVHRHGLRFGLEGLDLIEKDRKITKRTGVAGLGLGGWGTLRETQPVGASGRISGHTVESFTARVRDEGLFFGDRIQVLFIPEKTPSGREHSPAAWFKDLPADRFLQVRVFCDKSTGLISEQKEAAYRERFPWLSENVGFHFIFLEKT